MTTEDQMLMAEIASKAPELHPFLARNPHIYRICSTGLPVSMIPPSTQPSVCDGNPLVELGKSPTKAAKQGLIKAACIGKLSYHNMFVAPSSSFMD